MSEIRSWALTLSVILIVTGIVMKIIPESSAKRSVKFVGTLIIITCFFRLNISSAVNELGNFSFNFNDEAVSELNESLQGIILTDLHSQIQFEIDKILISYDKDSFSQVDFNDSTVKIKIHYKNLHFADRIEIEKEIEKFFGNEVTFEYSAVRENG